jgi:osmotically-inducible protein OsmY
LDKGGEHVVRHPSAGQAIEAVDSATRAIVLATQPRGRLNFLLRSHRRGEFAETPVFVVTGPRAASVIQKIYRAGGQGVFFWPADRSSLLRTVAKMDSSRPPLGLRERSPKEVALEELIAARLEQSRELLGDTIEVGVHGTLAMLKGTVDASWKIPIAELEARDVPGVEEVYSDAVIVDGTDDFSDSSVAAAGRKLLDHAEGIESSTIAIAVERGVVRIAGTAGSRGELDRAMQLLSRLRGVRALEDWAVVSKEGKRRDRVLARSLRRALALRLPRIRPDVSVFRGVAVLAGKVENRRERRALQEVALKHRGIDHVVDKLCPESSEAHVQ